jgi:biopolymer transport protein ExbD
MTAGCRRPTVLLPAQVPNRLDADALQAVLLHELAHIARRDLWIGLLQRLCTAIYWWNPLVRGLNRRLSDVRENVCDNYVLAHVRDRRRYARVLLDLAARVTAPPPPPPLPATVGLVAEPFTGLSARITGLLNEERNMETRMSRCSTACLTLFALLIGVGIGALAVRSELRAPLVDGPGMTEPGPVGGTTLPGDPSRSYDALPVSMVVDTGMNSLPMPNVVGPPAAVPATTVEMPAPVEFARSPADAPPVIALPDSSAFASAAPEIAPADAFIPASEPPPAPSRSLPDSFDLPPQPALAPPTDLNPFAAPPDTRPAELEPFASSRDTPPASLPAGGKVTREPFRELPVPVPATGTPEPTQPRPNDIILLTLRASDDGSLEELLYFTTPLGNGDEAFKKLEERFAEKSAERADPLLPNLELQITVDPQLRHEHVARVLDVGGRRIARVTFPQAGKSFDADLVLSVGFVRHRSGQPLSDTPVVFWRDQVHGVGDLQRLLYDEYRRIETAREREGRPARDGAITVLLQVDEAVGYDAVNSIIKQAQSAGFRKFILKVLSAKDALPADEAPPNVPQSRVVPADGTGDAPTTQVRFIGPAGMQVNWTPHDSLLSGPVTVPERIDVTRDGTLPLRFTDIPGRDGLIVDGELELRAVGQAVSTFLNRNAVPMEITDEDLDQVVAGNHVIKVVYVPDGKQGESGSSGIEVLVSTRLEAGVDPLDVAHHRGTILAVLWLGDRKRSP